MVYIRAKKLLPDVIIMENVEKIPQWCPLDENGNSIKEWASEGYRNFPTMGKHWYAIFGVMGGISFGLTCYTASQARIA